MYLTQVSWGLSPTDLAQTHCNNIRTIPSNSLWFSSHLPKKLQKVGLKSLWWARTGKWWLVNIISIQLYGESVWIQRQMN